MFMLNKISESESESESEKADANLLTFFSRDNSCNS